VAPVEGCRVGTLNSLIQISRAMSEGSRKDLVAESSKLNVSDWRGIILRGLFLNACTFVNEELDGFPEPARLAFRKALEETAASLASEASWFDLNPSTLPSVLESAEVRYLRAAIRPRIECLHPDDLVGLDFREAVNGIAFAWRERPDLRPVLASQFRETLPKPAGWPRDDGEVAALRLILVIARSELVAVEDAQRLLAEL